MKKVILLAVLMPFAAFGQIVEKFESGNINNWMQSTGGRWKADTTSAISGSYSLHHIFDNPNAGTDKIGLPTRNMHPSEGSTRWSFLIRHGYDPSSSNNWSAFLMSDREPAVMSAAGETNGFAIGVNLSGSDDTLRLSKVKGSILTTVINCRINWQTSIRTSESVKIIVERSREGNWIVSVLTTDENLLGQAFGEDSELFNAAWFGILYRYSSSCDRLLWIDDITIDGTFYEDIEAPEITGCEAISKNSVEITLNEPPSDEFMGANNFSMNSVENNLVKIIKKNEVTYDIEFAEMLKNKSINNLIINKICDNCGNCNMNVQISFTPVWAEAGDVIITEIMADPLPEVDLPGKKYLEITNRTGYSFNLKNWKLKSTDEVFPLNEEIIKPGEIMILCLSSDTSLFAEYGRVNGLKQFPSLTDEGKIILLTDSSGNLIHGVEFTSKWYGDELKSVGGWSLEMIDKGFPFSGEGNWTASLSRKGGTPGTANSVTKGNPDYSFYGVRNVFPEDNKTVAVSFSEPVFFLPGMIKNIKITGNEIIDLYPVDPLYRKFILKTADPFQRNEVYQLEVSKDVSDFAGNLIQKNNCNFGLPEAAKPGDILFNELLFNPFPGDQDYLELFNCSGNILNACRLQIVSVNDATGDMSPGYPVSDEKRCIMPGAYYAITTDNKKITERYFSSDPDYIFETGSLPSMPDDKGHLILFNRELDKLDEVYYNEKMHYSLLSGYEGIALEKTGPRSKSEEAVNWNSAAGSSGWGTPGSANSLFVEIPVTSDKVTFSSSKITPDNDGYEDFLAISFSLTGNANVISATVFDETGNYVKKIASNLLAGPEASLIWDGTADDGTLVRTGIYIVLITLFDDTGKTDRWKKVCTVVR